MQCVFSKHFCITVQKRSQDVRKHLKRRALEQIVNGSYPLTMGSRLRRWCNLVLLMYLLSLKCPAGNCLFKVNNRNNRTRCEICLESAIFFVNFEWISHLILVFLSLTLKMSSFLIQKEF